MSLPHSFLRESLRKNNITVRLGGIGGVIMEIGDALISGTRVATTLVSFLNICVYLKKLWLESNKSCCDLSIK